MGFVLSLAAGPRDVGCIGRLDKYLTLFVVSCRIHARTVVLP